MADEQGTGKDAKYATPEVCLSDVRKDGPSPDSVYAVLASDLHLRHTAPLAREEKGDSWYRIQARYLKQVKDLCLHFDAPLVVAGDVFHKASNPAELVNFVIDQLPNKTFAIPGNHDLPYHQLSNLNKSSYYTLMRAKRLVNIEYPLDLPVSMTKHARHRIIAHPVPWGQDIPAITNRDEDAFHLAVVHKYVWTEDIGYIQGIKPDEHTKLSAYSGKLADYSAAVFGDNHVCFNTRIKTGQVSVFNCGGFYRAKSNEKNHRPSVGLLQLDKAGWPTIWRVNLDTGLDCWETDMVEAINKTSKKFGDALDLEELVDLLEEEDEGGLDFKEVVLSYTKKKIDPLVREVLLRCINKE